MSLSYRIALVAMVFLLSSCSSSAPPAVDRQADELVSVLVPKADVPSGTKLNVQSLLVAKPFLKESLPASVIRDPKQIEGKVAIHTLPAGMPIQERDISIRYILHDHGDWRAMTIRISKDSGVGRLTPGSRVELVAMVDDPQKPGEKLTKVFMQNLEVLAFSVLNGVPSVTLKVTSEQSVQLYLIVQHSRIDIALRHAGDVAIVETPGQRPEETMIAVLIARQDMAAGAKLDAQAGRIVMLPRSAVPPDTLTDAKMLEGKVTARYLSMGQPIRQRDLADGQVIQLEPGYRAMTVAVNVETAVKGFITPGSRVDVLATIPDDKDPAKAAASVIVSDVKVLAIDVRPDKTKTLITLMVKPEQAVQINAVGPAPLSLVLRQPDKK